MKIKEKTAKKFFLEFYPNGVGFDFAGRKMVLEHYGDNSLETGWNIDHIIAVSKGGTNCKKNLQCTNIKTNRIKSDYEQWSDNDMNFKVFRYQKVNKVVKVSESSDKKEYNQNESSLAIKLFKQQFPLGIGYDIIGRKVKLEDFQDKGKYSGWDIVKVNPNNTKITDERNYIIMNIASISQKNGKTSWTDDERYFQTERKNGRFKIVEVIHCNGKTTRKGDICGIN
jgi:hypothetical protein